MSGSPSSPFEAMKKPIGVSASSMQMGDEPGGARQDRHAANEAGRNIDVAQRRGDRHRDVHRQRLAPGLRAAPRQRDAPPRPSVRRRRARAPARSCARRADRPACAADGRSRGSACAPARCSRATVERRLVQRRRRRRCARSTSSISARQRSAAPEDHRAAAEHAGGDRALKRRGIGGVGHARRLHGRRQAVLGDRDQAQIEKEALLLGRRRGRSPAGRRTR